MSGKKQYLDRRGVRVVEGDRLEICCGLMLTVGSNPTSSEVFMIYSFITTEGYIKINKQKSDPVQMQ